MKVSISIYTALHILYNFREFRGKVRAHFTAQNDEGGKVQKQRKTSQVLTKME